jgi:hypothetical protein
MKVVHAVCVALLAAASAEARPCAPRRPLGVVSLPAEEEWNKLTAAGGLTRTNVVPTGQTERHGHAEVVVQAPIELVELQVRAFGQYKDLAPRRIKTSRIVDKTEAGTDVYMQIAIMNGFVTIWQIIRFGATQQVAADTRLIEGNLLKGNVKGSHSAFALRRVDDKRTILRADILSSVEVPVPQELIDEELRDYAADALSALRDKAQAAFRAQQGQ